MSVHSYFSRLEDTLRSRGDLLALESEVISVSTADIFSAIARFYDGSTLDILEEVIPMGQ